MFDRNTQLVSAVSRLTESLDLFIIGNDAHIWSTYWGAGEVTMVKLIDNGPLGAKVTMVVVGDGFTAWDQDGYNRYVDALLANGLFTHDYYAANKSHLGAGILDRPAGSVAAHQLPQAARVLVRPGRSRVPSRAGAPRLCAPDREPTAAP